MPAMKSLQLSSVGPIESGTLNFGDLTVLVGPQASGKTLSIQLFKAIEDAASVRKTLKAYGYDWLHAADPLKAYLSLFFGGGMETVMDADSEVLVDGVKVDFMRQVVNPPGRLRSKESVFHIPAQRVLVLDDGWPRPFMGYSSGDPYCLRNFSETLRMLMAQGLGSGAAIFPHKRRLKSELRRLVDSGIYVGGRVRLETEGMRKRIVLQPNRGGPSLTYNAWSAGQREFTPLLLGLYWLIPPASHAKKKSIKTVTIEEPETGLHPQAIMSFCLLALELLHRGYKVIITTHSPAVLDVVWALRELKSTKHKLAVDTLKKIFRIRRLDPPIRDLLESAVGKSCHTYLYERRGKKVHIRDISSLDPGSDDKAISGWGGLSGFSGDVAELVGDAIASGGMA
jgi:AAA domain, putative AbiEii toxin, Type IV TA system